MAFRKPIRESMIIGDMAVIPLTRGKEAIIDASDLHLVQNYNWFARNLQHRVLYASRATPKKGGGQAMIHMHRVVLGAPDNLYVDHINGNGLDNRKTNLRLATKSQNNSHRFGANKHSLTGVRGVSPCFGKYKAQIQYKGKKYHLGMFHTIDDARNAYQAKALKLFREFFNNTGSSK